MKNSTKICLTTICKNESKVIERMLNSVYTLLDAYCVVDTGSTDNTIEIVENFFKEKGIPGKVIQIPWENFSTSRNKAIEEGKKIIEELGFSDCHFFWSDCDETLNIDSRFNVQIFKENLLKFDGANVNVTYGSQKYHRQQFYNSNLDWNWVGPVHEVLTCSKENPMNPTIEGLEVLVKADGHSWSTSIQEKYEGHAKILEEHVAKDPTDTRWVFYLAQSYRDAGGEENLKNSLKWYEKRSHMTGGYWEEVYYSLFMIASIKSVLSYSVNEVLESFRKCTRANRNRIEHFMPIILHYQNEKDWDSAYVYSSYAVEMCGMMPRNSSLFISVDDYMWKCYELHALSCWYTGRKEDAAKWFRKLWKCVERGIVPQTEVNRIRENKKYFIK